MKSTRVDVESVDMLYTSNPLSLMSVPNVAIATGTSKDGRHVEAVGSHVFRSAKARGDAVDVLEDVAERTDFEFQIKHVVLKDKNLNIELNREEGITNSTNRGKESKNAVAIEANDGGCR